MLLMVMQMFQNEKITVSGIATVMYVKPPQQRYTRFDPHRPHYELVYKLSGETKTTLNGKVMNNLPDTVEYLPRCEDAEYFVDRIEFGDCIDIVFDTDCEMPQEAFVTDCSQNKKIAPLFHKIHQVWLAKQDGYYYRSMALLYEILAELTKPYGNYLTKETYRKIEKGIEYLRIHCLDKNIDFYMPSTVCEISYTYFKKLFVKKFNLTPIQYVTKLRVERACELLNANRHTVTEVADLCGFENVYYFSTVFKKHIGISPKQYRIKKG